MGDNFQLIMKSRRIGEIITKRTDGSGLVNLEGIKQASLINFPENYALCLQSGGTAFNYHILAKPIFLEDLNGFAVSVVLTAGHCACDALSLKNTFWTENCGFSKKNWSLKVLYLTSFMKAYPEELSCSNNFSYCLSGDLSLLALISSDPGINLDCFAVENKIESLNESKGYVCGYPCYTDSNFMSMYPHEFTDLEVAKNKVKEAFFNFDTLVCSEGSIKQTGHLIEISASAYSGMSGSPIVVNNKLIGIFCGGPPLPGQREALLLARMIEADQGLEGYYLLQKCIQYDSHYKTPIFTDIANNFETQLLFCLLFNFKGESSVPELKNVYEYVKNNLSESSQDSERSLLKSFFISKLFDFVYNSPSYITNTSMLVFNTGISIYHPAFKAINNVLNNCEKLEDRAYHSYYFRKQLLENIFSFS